MYNFTQKKWLGKPIAFKQLLLCCLVLAFGLSTQFFYAQDVGSSTVKANFGIDGDVYSNLLQFPNVENPEVPLPGNASGIDDWFKDFRTGDGLPEYPGPGLGVIDQLGSANGGNPASDANPPNAVTNTAVELRQSVWQLNTPLPFPVVFGNGVPYLWLDAVYGRDTYTKGGSAETSYFAGGADKNSDNPINWTLGTMGSVPQKTDIVDVYAHLRGTNPHDPSLNPGFPLDDRPFDELYAYAGASLAVTNGNKHLDFEFFRVGLETPADLDNPAKLGPDGGRTAWTFDADGMDDAPGGGDDGTIGIPGTIIISVDYLNGGSVPDIRIRVWMSLTTFNNFDNTWDGRPFNVDKGVAFEQGTGSGEFGYAAINPKNNDAIVDMWGRVNDNFLNDAGSLTLGPPWGTFEGSGPDFVTDYQRYQFVEIGINLTAFGLDRRGVQDPCSNLLGSLLVKTRSSGGGPNEGAFGSELKDFAGPYLFGFLGGPPEIAVNNLSDCEVGGSATFDLNDAIDEANSTPEPLTVRTFHNNQTDAESGANPIGSPENYNLTLANSPKTIWVRSLRPGSQCDSVTSFTVTVNPRDDAEFDYPSAVCIDASDPGPSNGPTTGGGTWSVNNGATISQAGVLDLSTTTAGVTYTVTYTTDDASPSPCPDSHSEDILINGRDDAEFDYPSAVCIDASDPGPSNGPTTGGGTWSVNNGATISQSGVLDLSTTSAGTTYTVKYETSGPCPDMHTEDILINGRDDAEFDYPSTVCIDGSDPGPSNGPATGGGTWSVNNGATISQSGVLDLSTTSAGTTYTVKYETSGPCPDMHTEDILINGIDDAEFDYPSAVCIDASDPGPSNGPATGGGTWSVNNGATISQSGVLDLSTTSAGTTYTVKYETSGPCPDMHTEDILINGRDDAEFDYPSAVCIDASDPGPSNGPATGGGTWSVNNGATISQSGVLDLSTTSAGTTYTVKYETSGPCPDMHTEDILINGRDDAEFDYPSAVCIDASNPGPSNGPATGGGTWNVNNGATISQSGVLDLSTTSAGTTYTVKYETSGPCPDMHTENITINRLPICGITGNNFICPGETTSFTASGGTSYVWKYGGNTISTSASTGNIVLPGLYTVYVTDGNGCESSCSETLNVGGTTARPNVTPTDYCENDPQKPTTLCAYADVNGVPNATIEWIGATKDGQPYVIQYDQGTGCPLAPTAVGSYQFLVEIKTNDNCVTSFGASTDFNVYPKPIVDAGLSPEALCSEGGSVQLTGSPLGGTWSGSPYITAGGLFTIPDGGIPAGNYQVTYTYTSPQEDGGCSDSDTVDVPVVDCTDCGTAFGVALNANKTAIDELVYNDDGSYNSGISRCFREDSFRRWGWTNAIQPSADPYILDLYRGAGRCLIDKGEYVGYVTVNYGLDNIITAVFTPKDGDTGFDEIHLYVGCDPYPTNNSGAFTVAPGQYTLTDSGLGFAEGWSTSTDANKKIEVPGGGLVYVIAHTVACTDTSEDDAPNGFVPRAGYGEFQGNVPTENLEDCEVVVSPWGKTTNTKVTAYPVPFTDQVNVSYKFEYETDVKINVYDMKGALIKQADDLNYIKGTYGTSTIDLSRADDQMYFIRLTTSKESAVRKIISAKQQE